MNKVYAYILTCLGVIIILVALSLNNNNKTKKEEEKLENTMIEYCNTIYTDLSIEGDFEINLKDIEEIYNLDISEFKKNNCSLENSILNVSIKEKNLTCKPKLICNH